MKKIAAVITRTRDGVMVLIPDAAEPRFAAATPEAVGKLVLELLDNSREGALQVRPARKEKAKTQTLRTGVSSAERERLAREASSPAGSFETERSLGDMLKDVEAGVPGFMAKLAGEGYQFFRNNSIHGKKGSG